MYVSNGKGTLKGAEIQRSGEISITEEKGRKDAWWHSKSNFCHVKKAKTQLRGKEVENPLSKVHHMWKTED